jgi:hypothetical protein
MNIEVHRVWNSPANAEFRATVVGIVFLDGVQACFSLEPADLAIPVGVYPVKLAWSDRFQRKTPHLIDVPGRTEIEIHGGNRAQDSEGCILVGEKHINDYEIYESQPATDSIETALANAEANGEANTVTVLAGPMAMSA